MPETPSATGPVSAASGAGRGLEAVLTEAVRVQRHGFTEGEDPMEILRMEKMIDGLTVERVQRAAQAYFGTEHCVRVTLLPQAPPAISE